MNRPAIYVCPKHHHMNRNEWHERSLYNAHDVTREVETIGKAIYEGVWETACRAEVCMLDTEEIRRLTVDHNPGCYSNRSAACSEDVMDAPRKKMAWIGGLAKQCWCT